MTPKGITNKQRSSAQVNSDKFDATWCSMVYVIVLMTAVAVLHNNKSCHAARPLTEHVQVQVVGDRIINHPIRSIGCMVQLRRISVERHIARACKPFCIEPPIVIATPLLLSLLLLFLLLLWFGLSSLPRLCPILRAWASKSHKLSLYYY